jgi:FkbM family methyltransferase
MDLGQRVVYLLKPVTTGSFGSVARNLAKTAAGAAFDMFHKEYRAQGCVFDIPRSQTTRRMRAKFLLDTYELPERTLIARHISPNSCVLEMGASLGIVSCIINRRLNHPQQHVAVEVNAALIPQIEINRARNGCQFIIEHAAITGRQDVFFQSAPESDGGQVSELEGSPVRTRDLPDLESLHQLSFDTIVMDIEGAEIRFIQEYERVLSRINTMIVEFHPQIVGQGAVEEAKARLGAAGLRPVDKMLDVEAFTRT